MNGGARAKRAAVCESCGCRWAARWADCEGRSRARCAIRAEIFRSLPCLGRPLWLSAALTLFSASPKSVPPPWLAFHLPLLACLCNSLLSATPAACVPASSSNSSSSSRGVWSTPSPGFARRSLPCRRCLKLPMAQPDFAPTGAPVASANDAPRSQRFAGASGHGLHKRGGRRRRLAAAFYYPSTFRFKAFGLRDVSVVLAHAASFMTRCTCPLRITSAETAFSAGALEDTRTCGRYRRSRGFSAFGAASYQLRPHVTQSGVRQQVA